MNKKTKKQAIYWLKVAVIGIALGIALQFVRADWAPPTDTPPSGNVEAPINTGANVQTKTGGLNISGKLKVGNDVQPQVAGQIRWTGADFEGFNGTVWKSFTATGGASTNAPCYTTGPHPEWAFPNECELVTTARRFFFQYSSSTCPKTYSHGQSLTVFVDWACEPYPCQGIGATRTFSCQNGFWN